MSELGELDGPGTPHSPGAWDERSQESMTDEAPARTDGETTPRTRADAKPPAPRRTAADPVKALMHRHRELCARAVDPLEIAAGLEAHGITDRTATRFRHRDVFALAEEMFARAARDENPSEPPKTTNASRVRAGWALLTLLPGVLATATLTALHLTDGQTHTAIAAAAALATPLTLRAALSRGPLAPTHPTPPGSTSHAPGTTLWTAWLLTYALLGDGLLQAALTGGPDGLPTAAADASWPLITAPLLALAWSCAPAAWTAHLLAARAHRRLTTSRALDDFSTAVRPLLLATLTLYLIALTTLLALTGAALGEPAPYASTLPLGALLFLARLLTTHGFTHVPATVLMATATTEATALATVFAARLPGCTPLATPVQTLADTWGPASIPTLTCTTAALILLIHSARTLTRASAHTPPEPPC
ncbi:hypothetical protein [Streptomyces sp. SLBN-31]|uniref:hypothetical protein n=1 Tax=Streptomyces sp. SLBN-31 TaxID=2768444 RepID=UPI001152CC08|nr:hypothetical protein [Streptomyces sp. SLBN-31]TQJ89816.1 hypothetical protein FBY22_0579 [Streptomyces sp. SLBN-31]